MWNYHPDVVVETFVRFQPGRSFTLQDLQDRYIDAVLQKVGGSKPKASEILGIDISTLYRREKQRS